MLSPQPTAPRTLSASVSSSLTGLLLASVLALALPACETFGIFQVDAELAEPAPEAYVRCDPVEADLELLWERARLTLASEGYAIDESRTSWRDRAMVSRWNTTLAPTRYEGKRRRAWVSFDEVEEGRWRVSVAVQRQQNVDIDHPANPASAQWEAEQKPDPARAEVLLWKIEAPFRDAAPGG
jgi:hypothetical protein